MRRITEVTRRDLFDIIQDGFDKEIDTLTYDPIYDRQIPASETAHYYMPYSGRFSEIDFLDRLYHLEEMPSTDRRFKNAKGEIYCHTVTFDDWPMFWFLDDDRFELKPGFEDEPLLKLLCEMLHPAVREEDSPWKVYLERFNTLLRKDGYEIYPSYSISGRDVYNYHDYTPVPELFCKEMLFTNRYRGRVQIGSGMPVDLICTDITEKIKKRLVSVLVHFAERQTIKPHRYDNYTITTDAMYLALEKLNELHEVPVIELNEAGYFGDRYEESLTSIFTPFLFDIIELQHENLSEDERLPFRDAINAVFQQYHVQFVLSDGGTIDQVLPYKVLDNTVRQSIGAVSEVGLRDLLDEAVALHQRSDVTAHRDAMEKLWDALERLKTYYTNMGKKESVSRIIYDMAGGNEDYAALLSTEFKTLTDLGNDYRIRHHETNKIDITDPRYYDYFFNRCLSLIALAIQYLQ